jgi:hypothetical protein
LEIQLEGREEATYRRGSTTTTDTSTFRRFHLIDTTHPAEIAGGEALIDLPVDTMHSFNAGDNRIVWMLIIHGHIARWPDLNDEFEIAVRPQLPVQAVGSA